MIFEAQRLAQERRAPVDYLSRQQQQIEMQQQQLVAKEQRLKYLKQQEYQHHQMASEYDRLRR